MGMSIAAESHALGSGRRWREISSSVRDATHIVGAITSLRPVKDSDQISLFYYELASIFTAR